MLSISQFDVAPSEAPGFQLVATPMLWTYAPARIFGVVYRSIVQHWWPAAALVGVFCMMRGHTKLRWATAALAIVFAAFAVLHGLLAFAWSEEYRPWVEWYLWLNRYETERLLLSFAAVAALAWSIDVKFGTVLFGLTLGAAAVLFWDPAPITSGAWVHYANNIDQFELDVPPYHRTPELVALLFTSGAIVAVIAVLRRRLPLVGLALCAPMLLDAAARWGRFWYPLESGFFKYWLWTVLAIGGVGLWIIARWVITQAADSVEA